VDSQKKFIKVKECRARTNLKTRKAISSLTGHLLGVLIFQMEFHNLKLNQHITKKIRN
jgi:hypothetical protein